MTSIETVLRAINRRAQSAVIFIAMVCAASSALAYQSPATAAVVDEEGYVRLEVTLELNTPNKIITFQTACPKQSLWGIDLKQLLAGSDHITLGVSISAPQLTTLQLAPLLIDKKSSGLFGSNKSCTVTVDQIHYLSPAYYVRSYENQPFTVAPTFQSTKGVNSALTTTIDTALSLALKLSSIPAASAAPYQQSLTKWLQQVSAGATESFPKHILITPGPVPADSMNEWVTSGLFTPSKGAAPLDVTLIARLVPTPTLIPDPPAGAGGTVKWTPSDVLSSPFAVDPTAVVPSTLGSYLASVEGTHIANFRNAATKDLAESECGTILDKVQTLGLSTRDQALLMWALTHEITPTAVAPYDLDHLHCLDAAWNRAPAAVIATRVTEQKPVVLPGAPPSKKQMKVAAELDDAFAIFFKTTLWPQRRKIGTSLFSYPTKYTDAGGLLFDSSSTLENADQWLALHTAATPVANRVGCYTYIPAAAPGGSSVMYAIAEPMPGRSSPEAVLTVIFGNVSGSDDAKIQSVEVASTITPEQKNAVLSAQDNSPCANGWRPALVFGK